MVKKILAGLMVGSAILAAAQMSAVLPVTASVAEAGTRTYGEGAWVVNIDDSSVYMVSDKHARVYIRTKCLARNYGWSSPEVVDVSWGKGVACTYFDTGKQVESELALTIANYMSDNY